MDISYAIVISSVILSAGYVIGKTIEASKYISDDEPSFEKTLASFLKGKPAPVNLSSEAIQVEAGTSLSPGAEVVTKQGRSWYRSTVVRTLDDGTVEVDYTGWNEKEVVARDRIVLDQNATPTR